MNDREFLIWLHERLTNIHGESECMDYMHRLRAIIANIPENQRSPAVQSFPLHVLKATLPTTKA